MRGKRGTQNAECGIARLNVLVLVVAGLAIVALTLVAVRLHAQDAAGVRFSAVDVYIDSGEQPIAAYQLTFTATRGAVKIVGIEGGDHPAFKEAPYYDPLAIQQERAILAAFNTAGVEQLPKGRTRVATVHVQVRGTKEPVYTVKFETAANHEGTVMIARTSFQERIKQ